MLRFPWRWGEHLDRSYRVVPDVERPVRCQRHVIGVVEACIRAADGVDRSDVSRCTGCILGDGLAAKVHDIDVAGGVDLHITWLFQTGARTRNDPLRSDVPACAGSEDVDGVGLEVRDVDGALWVGVPRPAPRRGPRTAAPRPTGPGMPPRRRSTRQSPHRFHLSLPYTHQTRTGIETATARTA